MQSAQADQVGVNTQDLTRGQIGRRVDKSATGSGEPYEIFGAVAPAPGPGAGDRHIAGRS